MAIFDFLKKGKKEKTEETLKDIAHPVPRPRIDEIPRFPFEKEELLPPIKPIKPEITPLQEKPGEPSPPMPAPLEEWSEKFIPRPQTPEKPIPRPARVKEEVVIERPVFETEIRPEPMPVKPLPSDFAPAKAPKVEVKRDVPYVRVYKFRQAVEDLDQIAKSLKKVPTKLKTEKIEGVYERFEKTLEVVMKSIDSIERCVFE